MTTSSLSSVRIANNRLCFILFSFSFLLYFSFIFYFEVQDQVSVMSQVLLFSSYYYLVWLVFIENSSVLSSFYTLSKYNMKLNQPSKMLTVEITKFFLKPREQRPRNKSSMDQSADISEVQSSSLPHVSSAGENVSLPHVPLHNSPRVTPSGETLLLPHIPSPNRDSSRKKRADSNDSGPSILNYGNNQPMIASSQDGAFHALFIFGTEESNVKDAKNIHESLNRIIKFIKHYPADKKPPTEEFVPVVRSLWELIGAIFTNKWDLLTFDKEANLSIQKCFRERIVPSFKKLEALKTNMTENSSISSLSLPMPSSRVNPLPNVNVSTAPPPSNKKVESVVKKALLLQYESVDRLWTRVRVRTLGNYQSTTDKGIEDRHVTWKSCNKSLKRSGRTQGLEGLGRVQRWSQGQEMMSRDKSSSWCAHVQQRLKV